MSVAGKDNYGIGRGISGGLFGQMALHQPPQLLAVVFLHLDELDAAAFRAGVSNHGGGMNAPESGANLHLERIAHGQPPLGFQISAAQADGTDSSHSRRHASN